MTKSKRPELVRSESENLEYSAKLKNDRSVSLSNLLSKAMDSKQLTSRQSYAKFTSDTSDGPPQDTVIFIKSCCVNHDENEDEIKERRQVDKDKTALESQSTVVETMEASQLINEHNLSHKNMQKHLKMISTSEELISYKKRQKSKKKHRKSKQKQVSMIA